jgi:hypothetical protein
MELMRQYKSGNLLYIFILGRHSKVSERLDVAGGSRAFPETLRPIT